jgi:uncharacterized membrane protein
MAAAGRGSDADADAEADADAAATDVPSASSSSGGEVLATASIDLPFAAEVAYDAFSDLPRQATWSPWLRSVSYIDDEGDGGDVSGTATATSGGGEEGQPSSSSTPPPPRRETRWRAGIGGIRFGWNAVHTRLERPRAIEWESTSGLRNFGSVRFTDLGGGRTAEDEEEEEEEEEEATDEDDGRDGGKGRTRMVLTMRFAFPRFAAGIFRRSSRVQRYVEGTMLRATLENFRDVVMADDLGMEVAAAPGGSVPAPAPAPACEGAA